MKISFNPDQLFDLAGNPLVSGRVSFFLKDSDTLANTYYRDGNDFIEGQNPVILDNSGSFVNTIFLDVAIYDVVVEKYTDGVYHQIENFEFGFEMPDVKNDTMVDGIEGLMNANPELGSVTVTGYDSNVSCGPRSYIWDAQCTDAADGGCIVESNSSENGRWILLSDLRELPCKYYGVAPGYESNISAFLTYPQIVGTYGIWMPPVPRFVSGVYNSTGTFSVDKTISFDPFTRFANASFICPNIECSTRGNYIADFQFTNQAYAESSWFRTVRGFWTCGAKELHQSRYNYFENTSIGSSGLGVANAHISGYPVSMTGTGQMLFTNCTFAERSLSTGWYISMASEFFSDKWFADGAWDFGAYPHHLHVPSASNVVVIANFADANVYTLWAAAYGFTALDLQGRTIGTITATMPFTSIANGQINEAHFGKSITLVNVTCTNINFENNNITVNTNKCNAAVYTARCATWNDQGSSFVLGCDVNTYYTTINWTNTGCDMNAHRMGRLEDDLYSQKQPVFWRCAINNGVIASSSPIFLECNIANTPIYVYPCSIIEDLQQSWTMTMEFRGNRFNGSSTIAIGANNGYSDHLEEVFECAMTGLSITDNVFNTTVRGITCPFWSGPSLAYRFIRGLTTYVTGQQADSTMMANPSWFPIPFTYRNNDGNCPRAFGWPNPCQHTMSIEPIGVCSPWLGNPSAATDGSLRIYDMPQQSVFCMPALINESRGPVPENVVSNNLVRVDSLCAMTPYRAKATMMLPGGGSVGSEGMCCDFPFHAYIPRCAIDRSLPNDAFNCIVSTWGIYGQYCGVNPMPAVD